LGAHGIAEPVVASYPCIVSAIYNATGKWVDMDHGACNPDRVLKAMGKA
jgi:CO/xanthine dehydrogenase Mo-binding subunit